MVFHGVFAIEITVEGTNKQFLVVAETPAFWGLVACLLRRWGSSLTLTFPRNAGSRNIIYIYISYIQVIYKLYISYI